MAHSGQIIRFDPTRQEIRFIQTSSDTAGRVLEMESVYEGSIEEPPLHYHPLQDEYFQVISGELTVHIGGKSRKLLAGDALHIPPKTVHSMWNAGNDKTVVNWKVLPALDTELFLETVSGLSNETAGKPGLLRMALTANRFSNVFRLAAPAYPVQKIIFILLSPVSFLLGYRPTYRRFSSPIYRTNKGE